MAITTQGGARRDLGEGRGGERLDADDELTLMESDDVLQLGELADTARRRRGGTDDVYFVQNLYLNRTTSAA